MSAECQTELVVSKRCRNCNRESTVPDNFCRWCGFHWSEAPIAAVESSEWPTKTTTALECHEDIPRSFSSLPLNALTQTVAAKTGSLRLNRYGALVIALLVAIPMWLLIILLSPFDAYMSAKAAWSRMDIR